MPKVKPQDSHIIKNTSSTVNPPTPSLYSLPVIDPIPNPITRSSIQSEYKSSIHDLQIYRPANRGKKLKMGNNQVVFSGTNRPVLWPLVQFHDDTEMVSVGKRKVIRRKAGKSTNGMGLDTDPYEGIDIQDVWRLPEKYTDLLEISPIKTTFRSRHVHLLSTNLMELVETEYPFLRAMTELSNLLQGDDVRFPHLVLQDCLESASGDAGGEMSSEFGLLEEARFVTEEMTAVWNEYLEKVQDIRRLLIKAHLQKRELGKKLNLVPY